MCKPSGTSAQSYSLLKKKDLVKEASAAQVRVTQRINGASRQISKPMMVRQMVLAKFGTGVEEAAKPAAKIIHDKFRHLSCLFSDEVGAATAPAEAVSRVDLETGAVGGKSYYWTLVANRFNDGCQKVQWMARSLRIRCISCTLVLKGIMKK